MYPDPSNQILSAVEELRLLIERYSSRSVAGWCHAFQLRRANEQTTYTALYSPAKQISFLISLLLSTPQPDDPIELDESNWDKVVETLNRAFSAYKEIFWPTPEEIDSLSDEWRRTRDVAMPTFLHYFNTGLLATVEQVRDRIQRYLSRFDDVLNDELGISASQAVHIADWIGYQLQGVMDRFIEVAENEKRQRLEFLDEAKENGWSIEKLRQVVQSSDYAELFQEYFDLINDLSYIRRKDIITEFLDAGNSFWELFTVERGTGSIKYPTDCGIFETRPLILVGENDCMCPSLNALYNAILHVLEDHLLGGAVKIQYLLNRDNALEQEIYEAFFRIYGEDAVYYLNVYETPQQQNEHDLIIKHGRSLVIIESKATPPKAPFRDPDKAFIRIYRAFKSDTGLQKAYEQGMRLWRYWNSGEEISLYDARGVLVLRLEPHAIEKIYCICATRDDFGPIATNLSLLLEKAPEEPYPWAANVFDIQCMVEAWEYFNWSVDRFHEFLDQRIELHGKVFTTDEMELVGFMIQHGSLDHLLKLKADLIPLDSDYSTVFDDLYRHLYLGGPPVEYAPTEPFIWDLKASLAAGEVIEVKQAAPSQMKQGRNEPCACGSGKKYKRCCGRISG